MLFEHISQAVSLEEVPKPIRLQWYQARDNPGQLRAESVRLEMVLY
jgi:hypothetical protein